MPIWIGASNDRALSRVGRLADAYHASSTSPATLAARIPVIGAAAEAAGRPMPRLTARVRLEVDLGPKDFYTIHGSPTEVAAEIRAFAALGVDHLALTFPPRDADALGRAVERFKSEVVPLV